jgi:membrane associated rhomboid family serine protease
VFPLRDNVASRRVPFVNLALIAINLYVFFHELKLEHVGALESFIMSHGLVPSHFLDDPMAQWPTVFYSMFLHGGWAHVLGNMWFLFIFGDNVEDNVGHVVYVFYYLLMGIGAAAAQVAANPAGQLPMVGASGAIAGILGSYIVLYPHARVETLVPIFFFIRIIELPAFFFLGLWFVVQAVNGLGTVSMLAERGEMGGVAWWAHAGGFLAGFISIWFFRRRRGR